MVANNTWAVRDAGGGMPDCEIGFLRKVK